MASSSQILILVSYRSSALLLWFLVVLVELNAWTVHGFATTVAGFHNSCDHHPRILSQRQRQRRRRQGLHNNHPLLSKESSIIENDENDSIISDNDNMMELYRQLAAHDPEWFDEFVLGALFWTSDDDHDNMDAFSPSENILVEANDELQELMRAFQQGEKIVAPPLMVVVESPVVEEDEEEVEEDDEAISVEASESKDDAQMQQSTPDASTGTTPAKETQDTELASVSSFLASDELPVEMNEGEASNPEIISDSSSQTTSSTTKNPQIDSFVQKAQAAIQGTNTNDDKVKTTSSSKSSSPSPKNVWHQPFQDILNEAASTFTTTTESSSASSASSSDKQQKDTMEKPASPKVKAVLGKASSDATTSTPPSTPSKMESGASVPLNDMAESQTSTVSKAASDETTKPATNNLKQSAARQESDTTDEVAIEEDDRIVIFRMRQSTKFQKTPLKKLLKLGYSPDDILAIDPEALDLILSDRFRKPQRGVPSRWKIKNSSRNSNGVVEILDKEQALERIQSAQEASRDLNKPQSQPFYDPSPPRSSRRVEIKPKENSQKEDDDTATDSQQKVQLPKKSTQTINGKVSSGGSSKPKPSSSERDKATASSRKQSILQEELRGDPTESGLFAVYPRNGSFQKVPLDILEKLGYSEEEMKSIQPDALDLIVLEDVPKPKSGIPDRWKIANLDNAGDQIVQIMDSLEAQEYRTVRGNKKTDEVRQRQRETSRGKMPRREPIDDDFDRKNEIRRTRGERQSISRNGSRKPIYSGRQSSFSQTSKLQKRPDPPQPEAFWPDIDTFRSLLRQEAGFRINVLGDDWADIVKQESDWRLNLYRDWLWTLHDGIGNPIVESRSERARRLGRQEGSPRPLKPRSKKKQPRRRRPPTD